MIAVLEEHVDCVNELLTGGADVNIQNEEKITALMFAVEKGNLNLIKILISEGANVNTLKAGNSLLKTQLQITSSGGFPNFIVHFRTGFYPKAFVNSGKTEIALSVATCYLNILFSSRNCLSSMVK